MKINGKEFEFDIADVESMEKYEKALNSIQLKTKNEQKYTSSAQKMKAACEMVFEFFNDLLGPDASEIIFGGKMNARVCFTTYEKFIEDCSNACNELGQTFSKYSSNRAQRRSK